MMTYRIHFQELEQGIYRIFLKDQENFRIVLPDYPSSRAIWPNTNVTPISPHSWDDLDNWDDDSYWSE